MALTPPRWLVWSIIVGIGREGMAHLDIAGEVDGELGGLEDVEQRGPVGQGLPWLTPKLPAFRTPNRTCAYIVSVRFAPEWYLWQNKLCILETLHCLVCSKPDSRELQAQGFACPNQPFSLLFQGSIGTQ